MAASFRPFSGCGDEDVEQFFSFALSRMYCMFDLCSASLALLVCFKANEGNDAEKVMNCSTCKMSVPRCFSSGPTRDLS